MAFSHLGIFGSVPQEYINTLRESLLNRCPTSSYDQACQVVKKELVARLKNYVFEEFDPEPIASASLTQVHVARTLGFKKREAHKSARSKIEARSAKRKSGGLFVTRRKMFI
ncbi:putative UbiB domain-containing protein [Helianthus annuus]|nr:putative UbiB domain-containing protein [Helianthus annuus]